MIDAYELVDQLISSTASQSANTRQLADFAYELGWKPSYQFELPGTEEFVAGNLVVEHGLENSAVISFLRRPSRFEDLDFGQRKSLISASYNNLIDWHIAIDADNVNFVHNRIDPPRFFIERRRLGRDRTDELTVTTFESISAKHPVPNAPALDTAVVKTISFWKRALQLEIASLTNENISALFNGVILGRALEDHFRKDGAYLHTTLRRAAGIGQFGSFRDLLSATFDAYSVAIPDSLWNPGALAPFDTLDVGTVRELINDFYRNRFEHYFDYDFSIMSKHALSRIYEHYVSLLRMPDPRSQKSLFPELPVEVKEKSFGNVYTPEFIARFFAKYVRREMPLHRFQRTVVGDPACGSGIFLRSMIEMKAESLFQDLTTRNLSGLFESVEGVDIDANACASTRLSLSLLSLVLTNSIPIDLKVLQADALQLSPEETSEFDVIVANPPFVKTEDLSAETRDALFSVLGSQYKGKPDLYLGILKVSLSLLKDGGYGCFVLPKNFLISENAKQIRELLLASTAIKCVVDLSSVRVFEDVGAYVILLIFQKASISAILNPDAPVLTVYCSDLVGQGLEDALDQRITKTPAYQVYWSNQPRLEDNAWTFPTPEQRSIGSKVSSLSRLSELAEIRQGMITGADDVFIRESSAVSKAERDVYLPFVHDRNIEPFKLTSKVEKVVFYPFEENKPLNEARLAERFPTTWKYLEDHRAKLAKRKSIKNTDEWWKPSWPREPKMLLRPKIITPHLVISPRFAWDETGRFAVSHTPYIVPKGDPGREQFLYFLAVLNSTSCFHFISQAAHNYSRGYSRLEVATLKDVRLPDPTTISSELLREIIQLCDKRLKSTGREAQELEAALDTRVADAYGLNESERRQIGLGMFG